MTAASAVQFALALREAHIRQYAQERFPGIERLEERSISVGGNEAAETLAFVGSWHGVWIEFTHSDTAIHALVVAQCRCCHRFATLEGRTGYIPDAAALAGHYAQDPPADIDQCRSCEWLHAAQLKALQTSSWLARRRFEFLRSTTVDEVLARHRPRG